MKEKIILLIQKYKIFLILGIIAFVIIVISSLSSQKTLPQILATPTPEAGGGVSRFGTPKPTFKAPSYSSPAVNEKGEINLNSAEVKEAITSKNKLKGALPIYIENFTISNGMKTTLNVYSIPEDPDYLIHVDIYGINYNEQSTDKEVNPNTIAFIESFNEIKKRLTTKGVDLKKIYFIFGGPEYVQKTAELWIKTFNLL